VNLARYRLAVAGIGILLALLAIGLDERRLTWAAIAVLAIALLMRGWTKDEKRDASSEE
jgi:hypothetical protein